MCLAVLVNPSKQVYFTDMGKFKWVEDRFSQQVRAERERRGWTQSEMAKMLSDRGIAMHWTTVAKIEKGDRSVRIDEAAAIAELFGASVDVLLGRGRNNTDLAWAVSKLTGNAQKTAADIVSLRERVSGDLDDARSAGLTDGDLAQQAEQAVILMSAIETALARLAGQFPLPT